MARRLRVEFPGAIHHVTCRGVEKRILFVDDRDRRHFLGNLSSAIQECDVRLFLYCLMRNHVHLLVETPGANLAAFMHKLETAYAVYFNLRHERVGHLMQGRYSSVLVQGDEYLLKLSRYIHLNPVCVGVIRDAPLSERLEQLRAYVWSSYREYVGLAPQIGFLEVAPVLALVSPSAQNPRQRYAEFIESGLATSSDEFKAFLRSAGGVVGDKEYAQEVRNICKSGSSAGTVPEDQTFRRRPAPKTEDEVLRAVATVYGVGVNDLRRRRYRCWARPVAARMLRKHVHMSLREVAKVLEVGSVSAISRALRELDRALPADPTLWSRVKEIERNLRE